MSNINTKMLACECLRIAADYAQENIDSKYACKHVKLACMRFLNDLQCGHLRGWKFDLQSVERVRCYFKILHFLWNGSMRFTLQPWQVFVLANLFGFVDVQSGVPRFREATIILPRKNGLTTFAAAIAAVQQGDAYVAGRSRNNCFSVKEIYQHFRTELHEANPIAYPQKTMKMLYEKKPEITNQYIWGPHVLLIDGDEAPEIEKMFLQSESMARERGTDAYNRHTLVLRVATSRLENDNPWLSKTRDYAENVLAGFAGDDYTFAFIAEADINDDEQSELTWKKANPSYDVTFAASEIKEDAKRALDEPSYCSKFFMNRLNMRLRNVVEKGIETNQIEAVPERDSLDWVHPEDAVITT